MSGVLNMRVIPKESQANTRFIPRIGLSILVIAAMLFFSSGRIDWVMAWIFLGTCAIHSAVMLLFADPELLEERTKDHKDAKKWDLVLVFVIAMLGPVCLLVMAGLDARLGWSPPISLGVQIAGAVLSTLGILITDWAVLTNRFFSSVIRIQRERGHTVVTSGPYEVVRHPGYVGVVVHNLGLPLMLGSLWALLPAALVIAAVVVRTAVEDATLQEELYGYKGYVLRVRYRLLPYVW